MRVSVDVVDLKPHYSAVMTHCDSSMCLDLKAGVMVQSYVSHLVSLHSKIVSILLHYLLQDPVPEETIPLMVMGCPTCLNVSVYFVNVVHSVSESSQCYKSTGLRRVTHYVGVC